MKLESCDFVTKAQLSGITKRVDTLHEVLSELGEELHADMLEHIDEFSKYNTKLNELTDVISQVQLKVCEEVDVKLIAAKNELRCEFHMLPYFENGNSFSAV